MKDKILNKEFVIKNGTDCEELYCDIRKYGDKEFQITEDGKEVLFTGISYLLFDNGNLDFYCYYKDGFKDGEYVEFYEDGGIKNMRHMQRGRIYGYEKKWYENGLLKSEANYEYGVCLTFKEWNEQGVLIKEKLAPTEDEIKLRNSQEEWYKKARGIE